MPSPMCGRQRPAPRTVALTAAATSDGGGVVVMTDDGVGIQLGAIVEQVKQNLLDRGVEAAQVIPAVDKVVIIGTGKALVTIRNGVRHRIDARLVAAHHLARALRPRHPHRSQAVTWRWSAPASGSPSEGAPRARFAIGYPVIGQAAVQLDLSPAALDVIYGSLIASMSQTALIVSLLGVFIAVLGWFMGRSGPAVRSRGFVRSVNASTRRPWPRAG